jgi:predicted ArsR family transcriptional regulator
LAGLDTLGVERATALEVVKSVALDSVPPNRRRAYEFLNSIAPAKGSTTAVANKLGLPTNTARRILEDLTAYGLTERISQGLGQPDNWGRLAWEE